MILFTQHKAGLAAGYAPYNEEYDEGRRNYQWWCQPQDSTEGECNQSPNSSWCPRTEPCTKTQSQGAAWLFEKTGVRFHCMSLVIRDLGTAPAEVGLHHDIAAGGTEVLPDMPPP